ncbi:helix-turn-helix domain-containing protein [Streptomyces sp. NPDC059373]
MPRQPTITEIAEIASPYAESKPVSVRALAREYRVGRKTMRAWIRDANIDVPPRGYQPETAKAIIRDYRKNNASIRELVEAYGGSYGGIRNLLLDNGIRLRGRGQNDVRKHRHQLARSRPDDAHQAA